MYSNLPTGQLISRLDRLSRTQASVLVIAGMAGITLLDIAYPGIGFAPLDLAFICVASWRLGIAPGYAAAAAGAMLATICMPGLIASGDVAVILGKFLIRAVALGFIASVILSFRRSYERERFLARRDRMTGALNQEAFREQAPATCAAARAAGRTLLIALVDFDNFKAVNTEHGHAAGDEVLKRFAVGVRSILRREDDFGRLGGDEFAVIATVHSPEDAEGFARALHERLSNVLRDGPFPVTCSMGALIVPAASSGSASDLLHRADMLMYGAKHGGKDGLHLGWCDSAAIVPTDVVLTESLKPA